MVALIAFACKASRFAIALLFVLFSLVEIFPEYRGIRSIKYFTDHRTGNTIQLVVVIKGAFSIGFFF